MNLSPPKMNHSQAMDLLNQIWDQLKEDTVISAFDMALLQTWDFEVPDVILKYLM